MNGSKKRGLTQNSNDSSKKQKLSATKSDLNTQTTDQDHVNSDNYDKEPEINFELLRESYELKEISGKKRHSWAWEHFDKIVSITGDNAGNMRKAAKLLGKPFISCFAHVLNLVVKNTIPNLKID